MKNILCSWSGGKDCCYALIKAKEQGYNPVVLLNMMNEDCKTSRSHELPVELLSRQAKAMNIRLITTPTSAKDYEVNFVNALKQAKTDYQLHGVVYGDIDLVAHREWQERICNLVGLKPILPLWEQKREALATEIIAAGIESIIVSCNKTMGEKYPGKMYSSEIIADLKDLAICPCGEDGEFHSFVIDSPLHQQKVKLPAYSVRSSDKFHYIDWKTK